MSETIRTAKTPEGDAMFVLELAVRLRWDARTHDPDSRGALALSQIGSGTLDALLWVMGVTDLCPSSGQQRPDRARRVVEIEADLAESLRLACPEDTPERLYLGGVADALDFVLGVERRFWWVPIPDWMRPGRNQYGRAVA